MKSLTLFIPSIESRGIAYQVYYVRMLIWYQWINLLFRYDNHDQRNSLPLQIVQMFYIFSRISTIIYYKITRSNQLKIKTKTIGCYKFPHGNHCILVYWLGYIQSFDLISSPSSITGLCSPVYIYSNGTLHSIIMQLTYITLSQIKR